ncbi:MAG: YbjN domain-containing protein [Neomegalonema sp.]|nr:YbjN domain-containing protein [Neomegalonema sp.]
MLRLLRALTLALGAIVCFCTTVAMAPVARAETVYARDLSKIVRIAQRFGPAKQFKSKQGWPLIRGRIEGVAYVALFYGCERDGRCTDFDLAARWNAKADPRPTGRDLPRVNEWNRGETFSSGVAYIEPNGAVTLRMSINLEFGADRRTVEAVFEKWRLALRRFPHFFFK